jgi:O-antigen/teichoic acid export membrane protein
MKGDNSQNQMFSGPRDNKNAFWGIANQITNVFVQGSLIVFASTLLDTRNLNVWLLLLSFYALLSALPLSLEPIILRNLQGIELNDHRFSKFEVVPASISDTRKNVKDLSRNSSINSIKRIALLFGILGFFSYFFLALIYLLISHKLDSLSILISILCMSISIFALGPSTYYRSRLRTFNNGHLISQVQIFSRLAILLVFSLLSGFNLGVLSFTIGYSFGWLLEMIILRYLVNKMTFYEVNETEISYSQGMKIVWRAIKGIYKQNLIVAISSFMILRGTSLIAGFSLGDLMLSKFLMTQQLLSVLSNVSAEFIRQGAPKFNFLQLQTDRSLIRRFYRRVLIMTLMLYAVGSLFLISYSAANLQDFSSVRIFSGLVLYALIIAGALELNTICATSYFASKNQVLHANSYLLSSFLTICSVSMTAPTFGINSLILLPMIIQISYNHWKWPLNAFRDLKSTTI